MPSSRRQDRGDQPLPSQAAVRRHRPRLTHGASRPGDAEALITTGCRIGAFCRLRVGDLRRHADGRSYRCHEKNGKRYAIPAHDDLDQWLREYIGSAGIVGDFPSAPLWRGALRGACLTRWDISRHAAAGRVTCAAPGAERAGEGSRRYECTGASSRENTADSRSGSRSAGKSAGRQMSSTSPSCTRRAGRGERSMH